MLIAKTESGERISAEVAEKGYDKYYCQMCDNKLILRKGDIKIHHFAHYPGVNCDHWWEPETELHMRMKQDICGILEKKESINILEKEYAINHVLGRLIADVYVEFNDGLKIAVECQLSPKSLNEMITKTFIYSDSGIYTLWVTSSLHRSKRLEHDIRTIYYGTLYTLSENKLFASRGLLSVGHDVTDCNFTLTTDSDDLKLIGFEGYDIVEQQVEERELLHIASPIEEKYELHVVSQDSPPTNKSNHVSEEDIITSEIEEMYYNDVSISDIAAFQGLTEDEVNKYLDKEQKVTEM